MDMSSNKKKIQEEIVSEGEQGYIVPPQEIMEWIDEQSRDHRVPRTAVARHVASEYQRQVKQRTEEMAQGIQSSAVRSWGQREDDLRASHYPATWGLGFIPRPADMPSGTWKPSLMLTACYTSLNIPRPFDPTYSASGTAMPGSGWMYLDKDGFPFKHGGGATTRRGGGGRGGFAMTTGPLSGNYPSSVLPAVPFNLGVFGFSNGGFNPEGLQYTDRPKEMILTGLRNNWAHEVYFVRSRKVMHRNVYGPIARDNVTPQAPMVLVNGMHPLQGVMSIQCNAKLNAPRVLTITVNSPHGKRIRAVEEHDTIQVFAAPRRWADPPLIFTGFVSETSSTTDTLTIVCLDSLGYLGLEPVMTMPKWHEADVLDIIRDLMATSSYPILVDRVIAETRVRIPEDINLLHKTRLDAVQTLLDLVNHTPRKIRIWADANGRVNITLQANPDTATYGYRVGASVDGAGTGMANATDTADVWPIDITARDASSETYNVVTIVNDSLGISVTRPKTTDANYPTNPIHRVFSEDAATSTPVAELIAEQRLKTQGYSTRSWTIAGRPERLDILAGEVIDVDSHLADSMGKHLIQELRWSLTSTSVDMTIITGRADPSMLGVLRLTVGTSL